MWGKQNLEVSTKIIRDAADTQDLIHQMQRTPLFWEKYVLPRITQDFEGLYRFLNDPYPDGPNFYLEQIQANLARLRAQVAAMQAG